MKYPLNIAFLHKFLLFFDSSKSSWSDIGAIGRLQSLFGIVHDRSDLSSGCWIMRQHHSTLYFTDLNHLISTTPLWINDQLTRSHGCYKVSWLGSGFYMQRVAPTTCFKPSFFSPIACITNLVLVQLQHFKSCYGLQRRKHICKILWRMALDCGNALGGNITLDIDPTKMSNNEFAGKWRKNISPKLNLSD